MWGRRLTTLLALYTSKGVTPKVKLRERLLSMPLPSVNKAEPTLARVGSEEMSPEVQNRGISDPTNGQQNFFLKKTYLFFRL